MKPEVVNITSDVVDLSTANEIVDAPTSSEAAENVVGPRKTINASDGNKKLRSKATNIMYNDVAAAS